MAHDVFVSYSKEDKVIADSIVSTLESNKIRCWYAPRDIKPGADWGKEISNSIKSSKIFVLVFSSSSNKSQRVLDELNLAILKEVIIIPFRTENLEPTDAMLLHLSSRHWLDAYDPSWEKYLNKLIKVVAPNLGIVITEKEIDQEKSALLPEKKKPFNISWLIGLMSVVAIAMFLFWERDPKANEVLIADTEPAVEMMVESASSEVNQEIFSVQTEEPGQVISQMTSTPRTSEKPGSCNQVGDMWTDPTDMAELVCVPEGDFIMGSKDSILYELPTKTNELYYKKIYLDAYWVDQTEVSIRQFKQFVDETGHITEAEQQKFGRTMNIAEGKWPINSNADWLHPHGTITEEEDDLPVAQVSWNDAMAYCEWAGRILPTEAQWEKAARGTNGFHFPFEDSYNYVFCLNANISDITLSAKGSKDCDDGYKFAAPIYEDYYCRFYLGECGSMFDNPYDVYNMLGNVAEWVLDDYDGRWYRNLPTTINPVNLTNSTTKVIRGGSWSSMVDSCRPTNRNADTASTAWDTVGFRCVYNP